MAATVKLQMQVPILDLKAQYETIREEVREAIDQVLETQHFILGPEVKALEQEIAQYCGCRYGVGVASGTDALILGLKACGDCSLVHIHCHGRRGECSGRDPGLC